jgi:hypothetical protein
MNILRDVDFEEVLDCFTRENVGSRGGTRSNSFDWARDRIQELNSASWRYVLLSKEDIATIVNPAHSHGWKLEAGLTPVDAAIRLPRIGECWENVRSHEGRDFSVTHVFLKWQDEKLQHIDGFHRLVAWILFGKEPNIPAYVAGDDSVFKTSRRECPSPSFSK